MPSLSKSENTRELSLHTGNLRYQVFAILWVIASLFHSVKNRELDNGLSLMLLTLASVYFLLEPRSLFRFVLFLLLQITVIFNYMPYVSNHWIFSGFVSITLLVSILIHITREKTFSISRGDLWDTFAPIIRIELIILYFFVVLHKLNYDFFDPAISCGTDLIRATMGIGFLNLPDAIIHLNAHATVIIEVIIPLLLIFRRTRNMGILIGLLFHNVIAYNNLNGYYDFSSVIFALYFLFTPVAFAAKLRQTLSGFVTSKKYFYQNIRKFDHKKILIYTALAFINIGLIIVLDNIIKDYVLIFWTIFSITYISVFILTLLYERSFQFHSEKQFQINYPFLLVIPLLLILNGFSPYIGFKTENSFAMFSNLRTENGNSNHFFIPADIQIFDYQKDLVEITSTSDPALLIYAQSHRLLTLFDLNKRISTTYPEYVHYTYKGKTYEYVAGQSDPMGLEKRPPYILRKLLRFRTISSGPNICTH